MADLSNDERSMMEHALGRDYPHKSRDYRNYYAAAKDGPEFATWTRLVERGLAKERTRVDWTPLVYFHVTDAGKAALDGLCDMSGCDAKATHVEHDAVTCRPDGTPVRETIWTCEAHADLDAVRADRSWGANG